MVDIMMEVPIVVQKGKEISIAVRFMSGEDFFCSTLLGYGGNEFRRIEANEECIFEVRESADCTKGETDQEFG